MRAWENCWAKFLAQVCTLEFSFSVVVFVRLLVECILYWSLFGLMRNQYALMIRPLFNQSSILLTVDSYKTFTSKNFMLSILKYKLYNSFRLLIFMKYSLYWITRTSNISKSWESNKEINEYLSIVCQGYALHWFDEKISQDVNSMSQVRTNSIAFHSFLSL